MDAYSLNGVKLTVKSTAPRHSGFGSTTQLCLAVGRAVAKAHGLDLSLLELVKSLKRTSTGGLFTFQLGGFIVAGGFPVKLGERVLLRDEPLIPPLIFHSDFPEDWRFVMVRPLEAPRSPDGEEEEKVFRRLREMTPPTQLTHRGYFLLASKLLPALLEKDAEAFGKTLTAIQTTVGLIYKPVQGSAFNPASEWLIPILKRSGALGLGQSSWGPTVYAFVDSHERAQETVGKIASETRNKASVEVVAPDNKGATERIL
jgi:beta-RFAP synthase